MDHLSPRRRGELVFVGLFVAANLVVPLAVGELFPFSRAPMFCDAPQQYCRYTVRGPDGRELPLALFGLHRTYWGNPAGLGMGVVPPASLDQFGAEPPCEEAVCGRVAEGLNALADLARVEVTQEVVGARPDGSVGTLRVATWSVVRPTSPADQGPTP